MDETQESGERAPGRTDAATVAEEVEGIEYDNGSGGNIAGPGPTDDSLGPVEPGSPSLEGALFVLLGAVLTVMVLAQLVGV
jgi:hypothetical protein